MSITISTSAPGLNPQPLPLFINNSHLDKKPVENTIDQLLSNCLSSVDTTEVDETIDQILTNLTEGQLKTGNLTQVALSNSPGLSPRELFMPQTNHVLLNSELTNESILAV